VGSGDWNERGHSFVFYSDDHGKSWNRGETTTQSMNECEVVELDNGELLLSMRNYRGKAQRAFSISKNGGETWSDPINHTEVYCPTCQASLHRDATAPENSRLLYSGPAGPGRKNLSLRISTDDGKTWPEKVLLNEGHSAYSDIAVLPDGTIVCLFEAGKSNAYETIRCVRLKVE